MPKAVYDEIMNQLASLNATVQRLTAIIEEKNQIILNQNRARFGQSSEKRSYVLSDGQPGQGKIVTNRRLVRLTGELRFPVSTSLH